MRTYVKFAIYVLLATYATSILMYRKQALLFYLHNDQGLLNNGNGRGNQKFCCGGGIFLSGNGNMKGINFDNSNLFLS